jgi:DNA-binding Lrp family transcriptional regulator
MCELRTSLYDRNIISILPFSRAATLEKIYTSESDLIRLIKKTRWSHGIFYHNRTKDRARFQKVGHRCTLNFSQSSLLVAEVDEGWKLADALKYFADKKYIIYTTKSHRKVKNGKISDRFRIILFLKEKVYTHKQYTDTWHSEFRHLPVDVAASDCARYWEPCGPDGQIFTNDGNKITPIKSNNREQEPAMLFHFDDPISFKVNWKKEVPPELLIRFGRMNVSLARNFCRLLLSMPHLATPNGFDLPINNVAKTLKCSRMQASRLLKKAVKAGILKIIDEKTKIGEKARTYQSLSVLTLLYSTSSEEKPVASAVKKAKQAKIYSINITNTYGGGIRTEAGEISENEKIVDGNANNTLLYAVNLTRGDPEKYFTFVYSLKGIEEKDRERQAVRILKYYHLRKQLLD